MIKLGVCGFLEKVVCDNKMNVRKESCWAISNLFAGTKPQLEYLMKKTNLMKSLEVLVFDREREVKIQ